LDEAIATRKAGLQPHQQHQGMDPPEDHPPGAEAGESIVAGEGEPFNLSNASGSYYAENEGMEVSKTESQFGEDEFDTTSFQQDDGVADYSYNSSPEKQVGDYYQDQSREDQYYDSPEGLKDQPGSQDHEFFNAPSGGGDDDEEDEDYDPSTVPSFDPRNHMGHHPDDHNYSNGGYFDEPSSKVDLQESSGAEYYHQQQSPSPIKVDHLRRLGQKKSQHNASAMTSPTSQASSQNSVSEYSHSSAMRGAQELLKRNRQRRQEL
jgi:hypothetical protein